MTSIKILSPARKRAFDEVPKLSKDERIGYLTLDKDSRKIVNSLKTPVNKVGFLLQRAYFQAKGRFFTPEKFRPKDKKAAEKSLGLKDSIDLSEYNPKTASHHKKLILDSYKWRAFSNEDVKSLKTHALIHVDKQISTEDTLFALLDYCWRNKIEIPGYAKLSEIVSESYHDFESDMLKKVKLHLSEEQKDTILTFIDEPELVSRFSDVKRIDQSDTMKKLNQNARLLNLFKEKFHTVRTLLEELNLTNEANKHFADWVYKSELNQIRRLKDVNQVCLNLSAFIKDQYYLRQDYSVDAILKVMRGTINKARGYDRKQKEQKEKEIEEANQSVLNSAKSSHQILRLIIEISNNTAYSLAERNQKVVHLAESFFEAENPNLVAHMQKMESSLTNSRLKLDFYKHLFSYSDSLQKSLSPFIQVLEFDKANSDSALIKAIEFFSNEGKVIDENTPIDFLSKDELKMLEAEDNVPRISRYKVLLFSHIETGLRNRSLTLKHSYRYRANITYMIPDSEWKQKKDELLTAARLLEYKDGKSVLNTMGKTLTETYNRVNDNYINKVNKHLNIDEDGNWKLKKSEAQFDASKYIPNLLNNSKFKLLYELLTEIDIYTNFSDKFTHSSVRKAKSSVDKRLIYATLMSLGTNLGHGNMAKATKDISNRDLRETDKLWFDAKNVEEANRSIVNVIQSLPLPTLFNDKEGEIHTSNDGKKIVVAVNSLLANYSYKYYGKEQGINVNSFIDEKQSFFHVNVLTSSDREAPYVMDGIVKTKANLFREGESKHMHSSDTHGYTEAVFAGLHFLDVSFAPRIAKMHEQTIYAYESKSLRKNSKKPLGPNTAINKKRILNSWDDILRLMATIKLRRCSASHIFKVLSASKKDNELYMALKEFGRLIKSKFILDYIDDENLRKSIQKQLNRAELGQRLSETVFFGRKGRLFVGTPEEMQKVMACKTLLKNAIILWNYFFLSDYYHSLENKEEQRSVLESISSGSVISWRHINMHGLYDFNQKVTSSFTATIKQMKNIKVDID